MLTKIRCQSCQDAPTACATCANIAYWVDVVRMEGYQPLRAELQCGLRPDTDKEIVHEIADTILCALVVYLAATHPERAQIEPLIRTWLDTGKWYA